MQHNHRNYSLNTSFQSFLSFDRTQPSWEQLWIVENVPTVDCTVDAVQLHIIACSNDVYKDHEGSRRRRSFGMLKSTVTTLL